MPEAEPAMLLVARPEESLDPIQQCSICWVIERAEIRDSARAASTNGDDNFTADATSHLQVQNSYAGCILQPRS